MIGQKYETLKVRLIHLSRIYKELLTILQMNFLKINCTVMELKVRQFNGLMFSCAKGNKELWLVVLNQASPCCPSGHRSWSLFVLFAYK